MTIENEKIRGHEIPQGVGLGAIAFLPGLVIGFAKG